jgi:D-sedoheptulose 7-phosphate isomerase
MKRDTAAVLAREAKRGGLEPLRPAIERAFQLLVDCFSRGGKVLVCGNGGSAADSEHIVGELMKGFRLRRPIPEETAGRLRSAYGEDGALLAERLQGALPAISLVSQTSLGSAILNDLSGDLVFAQQVYGYGVAGDVLIAISTSGNARNVLAAARVARVRGLAVIGLTGKAGGALKDLCDLALRAPATETHEIQVFHLRIYHTLCAMVEAELFDR